VRSQEAYYSPVLSRKRNCLESYIRQVTTKPDGTAPFRVHLDAQVKAFGFNFFEVEELSTPPLAA
jgi:hypothetical protein